MLCFALWSFALLFAHNPHTPKAQAMLFFRIGSFGYAPIASFFLWFTVIFTERKNLLKSRAFCPVIFAIPALFFYIYVTGHQMLMDLVKQPYGWAYDWADSIWVYLFYLYFAVFITISLYFIVDFGRKQTDPIKRKQAKMILIATLIATTLGGILHFVLPELHIHYIPSVGNLVMFAWVFMLIYTITKYEFLAITPATAAENIISTMTDSLILLDPGGKILTMNEASCGLLGYEKAELAGKDFSTLFSAHSVGKLNIADKEFVSLVEEGAMEGLELTYVAKGGEKRVPVLFSASVMRAKAGSLQGFVIVARDITGIKKTEEELRQINEQLKENERAVLNVLADLEKSHGELKASQEQLVHASKMASIGSLVSDMAHEVNNPLMIISGRAQLSLMDAAGNKELEGSLGIIMDQCARAKDIIQRLLMFSKPSKGELKEAGVNDSVEFVVKLIEHQFSLTNVKIVKNYTSEDLKITIDEKQMHEVYMNLLKNAQDAMPEGGTITITTSKEVSNARIDFTDTGGGMAEEDLGKVFDPFFTTKNHGTGLGLSVCYGIVSAHGGELKYSSELGKGTTATILLPMK